MPPFPAFLLLENRPVLLLGDGETTRRKAAALAEAGAEIRHFSRFSTEQLDGCVLAIGADAPEADLFALSAAAQARGIPVNIVDRPELCSFFSPAVVSRPPMQVAIASGGAAPVLSRLVRARIEAALPANLGDLARFAARHAAAIRARLPDLPARRAVLERALGGPIAALVLAGRTEAADQALAAELDGAAAPAGLVHLLGAGPGAADLVTLRAQRLLGEADLVCPHPDVGADVVSLARRDSARLMLPAGEDPLPRLAEAAAAGQRVVRLLPGDGRDAAMKEVAWLHQAGIVCDFVPGLAG